MGIAIKLSGGVTLLGALAVLGSIIFEYMDKVENKYWKLFWAGVVFTCIGIGLVIVSGKEG